MFYVYEWYIKNTGEVIYVGKGSKKRYLSKQHNNTFKEMIKRFDCESRIIEYFDDEQMAYEKEFERINELKSINQCVCNFHIGGYGGGASRSKEMTRWTESERKKYSINNVMKSQNQRKRMFENNPMKIKKYAQKNGILHRKKVFVGDKVFNSLTECSKYFNVTIQTVYDWCNNGHFKKDKNIKCGYVNQQPSQVNVN